MYIYISLNMIYIIALSVIAGALGLYYFLYKNLNHFKKHGIPYKTPIPLFGNMGPMFLRLESMSQCVKNIYNLDSKAKYTGVFDLSFPVVLIRDPELIKSITIKHFDAFVDRRQFIDENIEPLFGKNLFALRGDKWRQVRALLSPAFTSSRMRSMFKLMSDCGADFCNYLSQLPPEQRIMRMDDIFPKYTSDIIATCVFGVSVDSMKNPNNEFYVYGKEATSFNGAIFIKFFILRSFPRLARLMNLKLFHPKILDFFRNIVETTIKTRDEKGIVRPDILQLMMDSRGKDGKELTTEEMIAQAFLFFFGGFDGTSTAMGFVAHEIAVNQGVQEKLQRDIDQVLEETNGQAPYEAIKGMEYLDAVINEALRMYPVAVAADRICQQDFELPPTLPGRKPFILKKGDGIWLPIYGLHHDPKYFEEPEKFDPGRFLGERKKDIHNSGAYLPFGVGPRMCIGNRFALLEIKVVFFHLLARCNLEPCEKTSIPLKIAPTGMSSMKPDGGFWLKVLPRKNKHHSLAANSVSDKMETMESKAGI